MEVIKKHNDLEVFSVSYFYTKTENVCLTNGDTLRMCMESRGAK